MIYIEEENQELVKYQVTFDKEALKRLQFQILYACAPIMPRSYTASYSLNTAYDRRVRNFKQEFVGYGKNMMEKLYHYEYEEYVEPRLCLLIDSLLNGELDAIYELKHPMVEKKQTFFKSQHLDLDAMSIRELKKWQKDLELYQKYQELNQNREDEFSYYPLVLQEIHFEEIERISNETWRAYQNLKKRQEEFKTEEKKLEQELQAFLDDTSLLQLKKTC